MAEFKEYPKVIHVGRGTFTVNSAEEEARYQAPVEPDPKSPDPKAPAHKTPHVPVKDVAPKKQSKQPKKTFK